ncbi:MAG: hypothetical protein F6J87_28410 [Spirulina sp. SIO3F2]|nr:hypothetical protein [Spirulina sp. SIO3F2]
MLQYQPYFNVQILHPYYPEEVCGDLSIEPAQGTQQQLKNHRLVWRTGINSLNVLRAVQADHQPLIPVDENTCFTFLLRPRTPELMSVTQLQSEHPVSYFYVFSNASHTKRTKKKSLSVTELERLSLAKPGSTPSSLDARCATILNQETGPLFGCIEIHHNAALSAKANQEFTLSLSAKAQVWQYYLVVKKGTAATAFSIRDKDNEITFADAAIADSTDPIATTIQSRFPSSQTMVLRSQQPVACRARSRPNLQLMKKGTTKPWIPHLPNPPNQQATQVINLLEAM